MDNLNNLTTTEQFEVNYEILEKCMLRCEKKGDYVQADNFKQKAALLRRKWEDDTLNQMDNNYRQSVADLEDKYNKDSHDSNRRWNETISNYVKQCRQYTQMSDRDNQNQIRNLRATLDQQLPNKVKESYQLLNLRQMQHHMSKQKDFKQAQLIQAKIRELYGQQLAAWQQDKAKKIEQAVTNLRARQGKDRDLFNHRMQKQLQDYNNEWNQEKNLIAQRLANSLKELTGIHQREVKSFKKQFKTKGGSFSSKYQLEDSRVQ